MGSFCIYKQQKRISILCYGECHSPNVLHNIRCLSFSVVYKCRWIPSYDLTSLWRHCQASLTGSITTLCFGYFLHAGTLLLTVSLFIYLFIYYYLFSIIYYLFYLLVTVTLFIDIKPPYIFFKISPDSVPLSLHFKLAPGKHLAMHSLFNLLVNYKETLLLLQNEFILCMYSVM